MRRAFVIVVVSILTAAFLATPAEAWQTTDGCITYNCWLENHPLPTAPNPPELDGLIRVDVLQPLNAEMELNPCPITSTGSSSCSGESMDPKQPTLLIGAWSQDTNYVACRDVYSNKPDVYGTCRITYAPDEDGTSAHPFLKGQAPGTIHDGLGCQGWDFQPSATAIGSVDFKDAAGIHWDVNSLTISANQFVHYQGSKWENNTVTIIGHAGRNTLSISLSGEIKSTADCQIGDSVSLLTSSLTGYGNVA